MSDAPETTPENSVGCGTDSGAKREQVVRDFAEVINRHSLEAGSDTPDFILAEYLYGCLAAWNENVKWRERWYGREPQPVEVPPLEDTCD